MIKYVNTEVEVEIELEDILEYIEGCSKFELKEIKDEIGNVENDFPVNNLYDREKVLILKEAMKKYNLEQLIEKLEISQADAL